MFLKKRRFKENVTPVFFIYDSGAKHSLNFNFGIWNQTMETKT